MAKILIADDEEVIRNALKSCLADEGYEIFEAADGIEALDMAKAIQPDLLLLDVMMPGMIGYRVCKTLKEDPATKDIQVLFLTARDGREARSTVKRNGGDEFISKPFDISELKCKVKEILVDRAPGGLESGARSRLKT